MLTDVRDGCDPQFLENDEPFPYSFFIGDHEIQKDLYTSVTELGISTEKATPRSGVV